VFLDSVVELDERGDLAPAGPGEPGVEHGDSFWSAVGEYEPEVFFEQVGAVEPVVCLAIQASLAAWRSVRSSGFLQSA
jgi:hypothetical protein